MSWDYLIDVPGYSEIEEKMSDDYLDLDPKGWEAAKRAFLVTQADYDDPLAAAIRAYESHKASAVPLSWRCQAGVCDHDEHLPAVPVGPLFDARDTPPDRIFDDAPSQASAVPEEIAEVVRVLRGACIDWSGEPIVNESTPRYEVHCGLLRRAADLLERLARPPSS